MMLRTPSVARSAAGTVEAALRALADVREAVVGAAAVGAILLIILNG